MSKSRRHALDTACANAGRALATDPVEQAAAEIRHVARVSTLRMALDVGEIIFQRIFGGDLELMQQRGAKYASFQVLAARADVGISKSGLWRCASIYELSRRVPALNASQHLGVSHVRAVLGLPPEAQEVLLLRAEREALPVTAIEAEVSARRRGRGGRPPKPEALRAIDTLMRVASIPVKVFADDATSSRLQAEEVEAALEMLNELEIRMAALRRSLRHRPAGAKKSSAYRRNVG